MYPYLFTDKDCKVVYVSLCRNAEAAEAVSRKINKQTGKEIVSWCHMGGENPAPNINVNILKK